MAKAFVKRWKAKEGNGQGEASKFWIGLCQDVLRAASATHTLDFERKAKGRRIDVFHEGIQSRFHPRGV